MNGSVLSVDERAVLQQVCDECKVPFELMEELIKEENAVLGMGRRHGLRERIDLLIREYADEMNEEDNNAD